MFAIAITLLVLDIAIPASTDKDLLRSLGHLWPSYLAYVVSFATIAAMWLGHNVITEYLQRADAAFIRLNLLLLLLVAFLPFLRLTDRVHPPRFSFSRPAGGPAQPDRRPPRR